MMRAVQRDLIYDVGMHKGEDSAYYLAKGYRVVGFEADPGLVSHCEQRFEDEIAAGRMVIVSGAITDGDSATITFYRHPVISVWGTTDAAWAERNRSLGESVPVTVPAVDIGSWLQRTGVPYFMKVDIEGAGLVCLEAVGRLEDRPACLSMESTQADFTSLEAELNLLCQLGYDRFAIVQQAKMRGRAVATTRLDGTFLVYELEGDSSGGFGDDICSWLDHDAALSRYRRIFRGYRLFGSKLFRLPVVKGIHGQAQRVLKVPMPGWYDTHACRTTPQISAVTDPRRRDR